MQLHFRNSHAPFNRPFTVLLMLASQRIESVMDFSGEGSYDDDVPTKRGAAPTLIELFILSWVCGKTSTLLLDLVFADDKQTHPSGRYLSV